jgi:hypothetical protein
VVHGSNDLISPPARGLRLAELTGGQCVVMEGAGHIPLARDPVKVNLLIRDFVRAITFSPTRIADPALMQDPTEGDRRTTAAL